MTVVNKKSAKNISDSKKTRLIEVVTNTGTIFHITLNPEWKLTFGALQQGYNHHVANQNSNGLALRIYETKERQLACFRNVESFRDLSIPMEVVYSPKNKGKTVTDNNVGTLTGHILAMNQEEDPPPF